MTKKGLWCFDYYLSRTFDVFACLVKSLNDERTGAWSCSPVSINAVRSYIGRYLAVSVADGHSGSWYQSHFSRGCTIDVTGTVMPGHQAGILYTVQDWRLHSSTHRLWFLCSSVQGTCNFFNVLEDFIIYCFCAEQSEYRLQLEVETVYCRKSILPSACQIICE